MRSGRAERGPRQQEQVSRLQIGEASPIRQTTVIPTLSDCAAYSQPLRRRPIRLGKFWSSPVYEDLHPQGRDSFVDLESRGLLRLWVPNALGNVLQTAWRLAIRLGRHKSRYRASDQGALHNEIPMIPLCS